MLRSHSTIYLLVIINVFAMSRAKGSECFEIRLSVVFCYIASVCVCFVLSSEQKNRLFSQVFIYFFVTVVAFLFSSSSFACFLFAIGMLLAIEKIFYSFLFCACVLFFGCCHTHAHTHKRGAHTKQAELAKIQNANE